MGDLVREPIRIEAFDVPAERTLRLFFLVPWSFVTDVELDEPDDHDAPVRVAAYRRVYRATTPGEHDEADAAFLTVGTIAVDLQSPLGERPLLDLGSSDPIPSTDRAGKHRDFGATLLEARDYEAPRWRFT